MAKTGLTDTMWLGNKRTFVITIGDEDDPTYDPVANTPVLDLTGLTLRWALSLPGTTEALICKVSTDTAEIEIIGSPTAGLIHVKLLKADTVDFVAGTYQFQLEITDGAGEPVVAQEGQLTLKLNQIEDC